MSNLPIEVRDEISIHYCGDELNLLSELVLTEESESKRYTCFYEVSRDFPLKF